MRTVRALLLVSILSCSQESGPPRASANVPSEASATPPASPSPKAWRDQFVADVHAVQPRLAFWPLVPEAMPIASAATVQVHEGCGIAPTPCLDYQFPNTRDGLVRVLEGPAGCCLDSARPGAVMDVEIRPGVRGQFDHVSPSFGGPIVWWVEDTENGPIYVAVSSPLLGRDELVLLARSMRPMR
jgi:hypothetical protein